MPDQIFETIITTRSHAGVVHVAPMGVRYVGEQVLLKPFKPSTTLDNILALGTAVLNLVTDVRVFAGCVTDRRDWPTEPALASDLDQSPEPLRLSCAFGHRVLRLVERRDDPQRPDLWMAQGPQVQHAAFRGFNRAQAAVIEGAVLVSRLHLLPAEKIDTEMQYLQIAIEKTAGPDELQAWEWLQQAVAQHRSSMSMTSPGAAS
ncbi:MAG TPA: DUF447 domain-containing protein [Burkholderiaceae bacterium]|nr:DUF447 domain-containing protein [Burkholderiaceae bacterium]